MASRSNRRRKRPPHFSTCRLDGRKAFVSRRALSDSHYRPTAARSSHAVGYSFRADSVGSLIICGRLPPVSHPSSGRKRISRSLFAALSAIHFGRHTGRGRDNGCSSLQTALKGRRSPATRPVWCGSSGAFDCGRATVSILHGSVLAPQAPN